MQDNEHSLQSKWAEVTKQCFREFVSVVESFHQEPGEGEDATTNTTFDVAIDATEAGGPFEWDYTATDFEASAAVMNACCQEAHRIAKRDVARIVRNVSMADFSEDIGIQLVGDFCDADN